MNYWLDLFTPETWREFRKAGSRITGFRHRMRKLASKIEPGDVLLCYVTRAKYWVGALKVVKPSQSRARIWKENEFPVRLAVEPTVDLDVSAGLPLSELEGRVSFFSGPRDKGPYKGFLRQSPALFQNHSDGDFILGMLQKLHSVREQNFIKSVSLSGFKCFGQTRVELKPFTVLMGENCSGKTSVLQAIALALRILREKNLIDEAPQGTFRASKTGAAYGQLPGLFTHEPKDIFFAKRERGGTERGQKGVEVSLEDTSGNVYRLRITSRFGAFNVRCVSTPEELSATSRLQGFDPLLVSGFVGVTPAEERLFPLAIESRLTRGRASEVLRNLMLDVRKHSPDRFGRFCRKLETHFGLRLGSVDFEEDRNLYVRAQYVERFPKREIHFDIALQGSGFLQIMQLLAAIYRCCDHSKVILLDEPDAHLHPTLQVQVANILREIAQEEGLQIILATHSTSIIRAVEPNEVVPVSKTLKKCVALKSTDEVEGAIADRLDNYTLARAAVAQRLVYVEDEKHELLKALDEACGTKLFSGVNTVPILVAHGKDDPIPFRIADALSQVTGTSISVHFLRDRDGLPDEWCERLEEYARSKNVTLHLWPFHELENAVLSLDFLHSMCSCVAEAQGKQCPEKENIETQLATSMHDLIAMGRFNYRLTLRDALQKTARLVGEDAMSNMLQAENEANRIADAYERLDDFDARARVAPGKETLREFRKWLQDQYGINVRPSDLHEHVKRMSPPEAVRATLREIAK
ncbi:MAG TPA: AAA family ATPase [Phycisphaerae bacterium]|nr:AAA family ATPase [Phycisphaerae bacterium]